MHKRLRKGDLERLQAKVKALTDGIQTPDIQFTFTDGTKSTYTPMEAMLTAIEHSCVSSDTGKSDVKQVEAVEHAEKYESFLKLLNALLYGHQPDDVDGWRFNDKGADRLDSSH